MIKGFALGSHSDVEEKAISLYASMQGIPCKHFTMKDKVPEGYIPVGTVEWFLHVTGWRIKPDNYPEFLRPYLKREVWETDTWPLGKKVFIKPSDNYKRFNGRFTDGGYKGKKKGPYICSDIITFTNEWRYYVSHGKIVDACWYMGREQDDVPAPPLDVVWPPDWVGSADFGDTTDRGLTLVEAHDPFATGWYGGLTQYKVFGQWMVDGWEYLQLKYGGKNELHAPRQ